MTPHLFVLGRTPELAFEELRSLFPDTKRIDTQIATADVPVDDVPSFMRMLGGTTKIGEIVGRMQTIDAASLCPFIEAAGAGVTFGISTYGLRPPKSMNALLADIKKHLVGLNVHSRFVTPKEGSALSSVVVEKQHVWELLLVADGADILVAHTRAVQPFEEWNARDYDRPAADPKAGMLPPKVARMIVNIALRFAQGKPDAEWPHLKRGKLLIDPFCGMGTVIAEALMTGWNTMGSDQSEEAIVKAKKNIEWLVGKYPALVTLQHTFFVSDAVHLSDHVAPTSVDAIVTEPFMGSTALALSPGVSHDKVKDMLKGLEKLYIGCLRDWARVLTSSGIVVIALPSYRVGSRELTVKRVVDMCETLGYTRQVGPIEYSRPQAVVKRNFYVFRKLSN